MDAWAITIVEKIIIMQHNTDQHNTDQHNTDQHNTDQHNTDQHNTGEMTCIIDSLLIQL